MADRVTIELDPETRDRFRDFAFASDRTYSEAIACLLDFYRWKQYRKRFREARLRGEAPPYHELPDMSAADFVRDNRRRVRELGLDDGR